MPTQRTIQGLILAGILTTGFAARVSTFRSPLLDHHSWRQADTAAIARNFYRERLNPFYPQVDQREAQAAGYVETGFELFAFVVGAFSRLAGFHPPTGRVLNCFLFLGSATLLHFFLRDRYGTKHGLVGAAAYSLGFPLQLYIERAFMNEASLGLLTFASFRITQRFLATGRRRLLAVLALTTTLIALIKLPYLIVWAGIAGLFGERFGWRGLRRFEVALVAAVNFLAAYLWYSHARTLFAATGLTFGMRDKLYDPEIAWSLLFLRTVVGRLGQDVLGIVALGLLGLGVVIAWRGRRLFELFGLGGFVVYVVVLAKGCLVHDYYLLAIVPVGSALVTLGLCAVAERLGRGRPDREVVAVCAFTAVLALSALFRSIGFHSWYDCPVDKVQLCRAGKRFLESNDRVAFVAYDNPDLLFCLDRRGWLLTPPASVEQRIVSTWEAGATVFVVPRSFTGTPAGRWILGRGVVAFENPDFTVVRVSPPNSRRD